MQGFSWENDTYFQKRYPKCYVSFASTRFCRALKWGSTESGSWGTHDMRAALFVIIGYES